MGNNSTFTFISPYILSFLTKKALAGTWREVGCDTPPGQMTPTLCISFIWARREDYSKGWFLISYSFIAKGIQSLALKRTWDCTNKSEFMCSVEWVDLCKHTHGRTFLFISLLLLCPSNWFQSLGSEAAEFRIWIKCVFRNKNGIPSFADTDRPALEFKHKLKYYLEAGLLQPQIFCQLFFNIVYNFSSSSLLKTSNNSDPSTEI